MCKIEKHKYKNGAFFPKIYPKISKFDREGKIVYVDVPAEVDTVLSVPIITGLQGHILYLFLRRFSGYNTHKDTSVLQINVL